MDGFKARLSRSIQLQLSFWLSVAILVIGVAAGVFSFVTAFEEANELQDDVLRQVSALFAQHRLAMPDLPEDATRTVDEEAPRVLVQTVDGPSPPGALPLPATLPNGMHTLELQGHSHRVFVSTLASGQRLAVSQLTSLRDITAKESAQRTVMPFLLLLPVLLLVLHGLVQRLFMPVTALTSEIDQRGERELHPLPQTHLAREVSPFVAAINRLLERVALAMAAQQRFLADAAHELRSPMTALSLQAERLAQSEMSEVAQTRLRSLREGIARSRQLLEQLLNLAQVQATAQEPTSTVSVQQTYRNLLEERMPLAEAKGIDAGVEGTEDVYLRVAESDLRMLVGNLLDNAIRYTPAGGQVDLRVRHQGERWTLEVSDNGPGIPTAERERVCDPFYRVLGSGEMGSGLGLSIVKAICDRWQAPLSLHWTDAVKERGLCAVVELPPSLCHR